MIWLKKWKYSKLKANTTLLLAIVIASSCITLEKGYISGPPSTHDEKTESLISQKKKLFSKSDSITHIIKKKKVDGRYLNGNEVNQLFENLGSHLKIDKTLQYKVRDDLLDGKIDSTEVVVSLYHSAKKYESLYRDNKFLGKTINRGDWSLSIPKRLLNKVHHYLNNQSNKRTFKKVIPAKEYQKHKKVQVKSAGNGMYQFINFLSSIFGNVAGFFHGKIADQKKNIQFLSQTLEPFDIVLSKSRKHLTDKFIPGYFGHVGIWIGSVEQLKLDGLDSITHVKNNRKKLGNQFCMLESLRNKTQLNALSLFADGEDYMVIRYNKLDRAQKIQILNTLRHIGKKYDFNFNVESPDKIYCTELVYYAFGFIEWKAEKTFGRFTLPPDNIAKEALLNPDIDVVGWISNGKILTEQADIQEKLKL